MSEVTAIINTYKRDHLHEQYDAVAKQTVTPADIMIWSNSPGGSFPEITLERTKSSTAVCNRNYGVWARFAYALLAKTKYVCIFDDDTIPGSRWFENCLETIKTHRGPLGTIGIILNSPKKYIGNCVRVGWDKPNEETQRVDFLGHAWFFEREWLHAYWSETPDIAVYPCCSEDLHLSYTVQKYLGLNTYVPPHPKNDQEMWGSLKGMEYGSDNVSIWMNNSGNAVERVEGYMQYCLLQGWKIING
jgi:hypothetical protein